MLEIRLLGTFEIKDGNKVINISSRPAQSLFSYLILSAGTSHRREKLAGMLWPDSLEETARDNLRHALWRIRKALPSKPSIDYLLTDDLSITFNALVEYWLDAAELEKLDETASADQLMAVLAEYQGELLPGFYNDWVLLEREHLHSIFEHHMARLLSLLQYANRWLDILDWGERWIRLGQKPEPAYRALMMAHAAKGDMSKVAVTYERCVKSLREFGMEPSEQTKGLYANLKSGKDAPTTTSVSAPLVKESSSNIPVPLTSFIGRERELKEIAGLLSSCRLLTLTGPGGVGKTRLAIQAAHNSRRDFKDGIFWVGLVGLSEEDLIPQIIARSLNIREVATEPLIETIKRVLNSKEVLLVIDNCEHLIDACAQVVEQLLAACPGSKVLATSIEALGLFNERVWQVPSLELPEFQESLSPDELQELSSIRLFLERASSAGSDFVLDEQNASSVVQICRRLDGIPLAIELAASRLKVLSVEEINSRLDDRFSLLTGGSRTAMPRHQTLRAAIDWSHDLLSEPERILFRRLSVFVGGFTLTAAEAVCGFGELNNPGVLDLLARLVDKSLIMVQNSASGSGTRYRLLETIHEYGWEKLRSSGEDEVTRDRHLNFYMNLAEEAERNHFSPEQLIWFDRVETNVDNMRAAMDWSLTESRSTDLEIRARRQESGLRLIGALVWFWHRRHAREITGRLNQTLAALDRPTPGRAKALYSLGFLYWTVNRIEEARKSLEEAVAISRTLDDPFILAWSLGYLGAAAAAQGDYASTEKFLEESLQLARGLGLAGRKASSWALAFLGEAHYARQDYSGAEKLYKESVALTRESHEKNLLGLLLRRLGYVVMKQADFSGAAGYFEENLELNQEVGHAVGIGASLVAFAHLALASGDLQRAARLFGAVESYLQKLAMPLFYSDQAEYELGKAAMLEALLDAKVAASWNKGAEMTLEQAMDYALQIFRNLHGR